MSVEQGGGGQRYGLRKRKSDIRSNILCASCILWVGVLCHVAGATAASGEEIHFEGWSDELVGREHWGWVVADVT